MHAPVAVEENRLLRSIPAARVALIERIARAASGSGGRNELPQRFLRAYFHGVADEDLAERTPRQLAKAALAHLAFAARRAPGRSLVQVFNPDAHRNGFESAHTLVMTVTDDMPFLVDSLGMAFSRAELAVHLIVHPVLQVRRDRRGHLIDIGANGAQAAHPESWQLYEIDRVSDPAQIERLQRDLEVTLADVRLAVTDWTAMRKRVREIITRLETDPPPLPAAEVSEASHLLDWMEGRHFVFLGYRRYRLERGRSEDRLVPDPRSGLGILSSARRQGRRPSVTTLRGDVRTRAGAADRDQGELDRDRAPRRAARLRRRQNLRSSWSGRRRAPLPRLVDLDRLSRQPAGYPGAAQESRARHRALRPRPGRPRRQGGAQRAGDLSAR